MDEVAARCIELIAQSKGVPASSIALDTPLDDLGIDSLDKVNLTFAVEEAFGISIPDEKLITIRTPGDMVRGIEELQAARGGPALS